MTKPNHGLNPALIVLMSIATGLAVASNYYTQPLLDTTARNSSLSASSAGFIVTAVRLGYAAGLLFPVPLGDTLGHRRLIASMILLATGGMLATASNQSLAMMTLDTALTGLFSIVAQILVSLVATLASPDKCGKVVGIIMSGLLSGTLLAWTVVGLLVNLSDWRTVFWVTSMLMALMMLALQHGLPQAKSETHLNYPQLLDSVFSMFISNKILRIRALLGCLTFASFNIPWASMASLFTASPFNYSDGIIDLLGLVGAAGALGTHPVDGFADKGKLCHIMAFGLLLLLLSWLTIWFDHTSVLALIIGILVLDPTVQGAHITNRTVIYQIHPDAHNRLTTGYMTSYFIGGAAGLLISAPAWQYGGWAGVRLVGAAIVLTNSLVWRRGFHRQRAVN